MHGGFQVVLFTAEGKLWPTIRAIDKAFALGFPVNDSKLLEQLANRFRQHSGRVMDGYLLALDGLGILVHCPFKDDMGR